jgi:aryl-alcohol dehydrogenase-like predicted oxidoreductase
MEGLEWLKDAILAEKNLQRVRRMSTFAKELGVPMAQLAIAWCLKNPNVSTVILGASKISQLEENLKALDILPMLTNEVMAKIEEVLDNTPSRPPF